MAEPDAGRTLFEEYVVPLVAKGGAFVLVAVAVDDDRDFLGHEVLHAQYFLVDAFRGAADRFWTDEVGGEDQAAVRLDLRPTYDVTDELLVRNEFMAYVLMPHAEESLLSRFVPTYRTRLNNQLLASGAAPIQVR